MISRRTLLAVATILVASGAPGARAAQALDYSKAAFDAAQKAGKPILVAVHASWCPTCAAQKPILMKLEGEPRHSGLVVFTVDFDRQKDALRRFGARQQSTLIAFKGASETARSVGDTNEASIAALLAKTL